MSGEGTVLTVGTDVMHYKTIAEAMGDAKKGDMVMLMAGVYEELVHVPLGVQLVARNKRSVVLRPPPPSAAALTAEDEDADAFVGCVLVLGGDESSSGRVVDVTVEGGSILAQQAGTWEITGVTITGAATHGIVVTEEARVQISLSAISGCGGRGIATADRAELDVTSCQLARNWMGKPAAAAAAAMRGGAAGEGGAATHATTICAPPAVIVRAAAGGIGAGQQSKVRVDKTTIGVQPPPRADGGEVAGGSGPLGLEQPESATGSGAGGGEEGDALGHGLVVRVALARTDPAHIDEAHTRHARASLALFISPCQLVWSTGPAQTRIGCWRSCVTPLRARRHNTSCASAVGRHSTRPR